MNVRFLSLLIHKIKLSIRYNMILLAVFCLGGFICTLAVIIMYGNVMPHMLRETPEKYYRSFDVYFKEPVLIQTLNLSDAINPPQGSAYEIEDIIVNTSLDSGKTNVKASRNNRIFEDDLSDAAFLFDRADLRSQMILSHNTASYKQTDTYEMFGNIYSVVGFASENYITYNEFYDLNLSVNFFRVVLKSKPTTQQKKEFTQLLASRFPECHVKNADFYMEQDREITVQAIGVMTVLYILLFLSLAFILYDILQSEMYVHMVLRLHGATSRYLLFLIVSELFVLLSVFGGLACLMHHLFYEAWFVSLNLHAGLSYGLLDYLLIVLSTDLAALCCMVPFLHKIMSKYSYQIKKEAVF